MKLTVAMATHDDFDGVYFTVQALRLYHTQDIEILVLDNNPTSPHGEALRKMRENTTGMRVIPITDRKSSFVKYDAFQYATGDIVLGLDCHVLLWPGFIERLMAYWNINRESKNMLTGPVVYQRLDAISTHMDPVWRGHDFGIWANHPAQHGDDLFEVPMQGMGCFSMLRSTWQDISPNFQGFGAEEWYIAEKVRSWGGRVICHPKLKWVHRFGWPRRTFPLRVEDKIRNYYVGWLELYGSRHHPKVKEMTAYWLTSVPESKLESIIQSAESVS